MNRQQITTFSLLFSLLISIGGLALVFILVLQSNLLNFQPLMERGIVGVLYCIVCILGIVAVFYPTKCKGVFQHTQDCPNEANNISNPLQIKGHHPNCQNFSKNRIKIGGQTFCAACSGLLVGGIIALVGAILYFFGGLNNLWGSIWLVALGEILMLVGLTQIRFPGFAKAILNAVFVIGSFVTLIAVDALGKSLFLDLYVFGLILFLLWFRISLSEWNNRRTCHKCQSCFRQSASS